MREAAPGGADVEVAPGWSGCLVRRRRDPELSVGDTVDVPIAGYDERGPQLERRLKGGPTTQPRRHSAIRQLARSERELKQQLRRARDRMTWLEEQLRGTGRYDDADQQFRHEVQVEWERSHIASERTAWPLAQYEIGPASLPSLDALEGVSRAKVDEVCVEIQTSAAETLASRELHILRWSEAGHAEQRVRTEDGARAWRVSLQIKTLSARRLHFWRLPDGWVELSKVGVHDDLTIA